MAQPHREPPFEGGSQPVEHRPDPVPPGRRSAQPLLIVAVVAVLLLSGLVWFFR